MGREGKQKKTKKKMRKNSPSELSKPSSEEVDVIRGKVKTNHDLFMLPFIGGRIGEKNRKYKKGH